MSLSLRGQRISLGGLTEREACSEIDLQPASQGCAEKDQAQIVVCAGERLLPGGCCRIRKTHASAEDV